MRDVIALSELTVISYGCTYIWMDKVLCIGHFVQKKNRVKIIVNLWYAQNSILECVGR